MLIYEKGGGGLLILVACLVACKYLITHKSEVCYAIRRGCISYIARGEGGHLTMHPRPPRGRFC